MKIPTLAIVKDALACETSAYVYDLAILRERIELMTRLPITSKRIHFATMANDNEIILREIASTGIGAFVNSIVHLDLALSLGFSPLQIIYAASNMREEEIRKCFSCGVHLVLDSIGQLVDCDKLAPRGHRVGLRVNVGSAIDGPSITHEPNYRFGVLPEEIAEAVELARNVRIVGLHCYFGTDIMDHTVLLNGLERLARLSRELPDLEYLDGGGGFGVSDDDPWHEFDLVAYGNGAERIMCTLSNERSRSIQLILEPGRWLAAPMGWFFAPVVDVKRRRDRIFAGVSASVAQFPRMLVYPERARHPCVILGKQSAPHSTLPVWITGNSTYSRDFLARGVRLPEPDPGDIVVFGNAGAYCRSMRTHFLGKEDPAEIVLSNTRAIFERPELTKVQ